MGIGQAVMHYSRHRLITASVIRDYNHVRARLPVTNGFALLAPAKTKPS